VCLVWSSDGLSRIRRSQHIPENITWNNGSISPQFHAFLERHGSDLSNVELQEKINLNYSFCGHDRATGELCSCVAGGGGYMQKD
jgi:hypothetical protein